jgi:putative two-component system hydrogenase maturation factor HypX/HoxX
VRLVDQVIEGGADAFRAQVAALAESLAHRPDYPRRVAVKAQHLATAAMVQPLHAYRQAELAIMNRNFYDPREPYAQLRRAFVYKQKPTRTPPHLSRHRTGHGRRPQSGRRPSPAAAGRPGYRQHMLTDGPSSA